MFKKMRRNDREITAEESEVILRNGEYGILSTINENEYPYGVPVNYYFKKGIIYIHCAIEGQKLLNINKNNKVSFCIIGKTEVLPDKFSTKYESVIIFGRAQEINSEEKYDALISLIEKYSPGYINKGKEYIENNADRVKIIKITIEHISGKAGK